MAEMKYKKETDYGRENDFVGEDEITVTITLNEYRQLVEFHANGENRIEKAEKNKYLREEKIRTLEHRVEDLSRQLYESGRAKDEVMCREEEM